MNSPALAPANPSQSTTFAELTVCACATAQQAVSHALDGLINGARHSLLAVRSCEERLEGLDRELDERLPAAITQATEEQARELLASLKMMLHLERLGDLVASFAERCSIVHNRLDMEDIDLLARMGCTLESMLEQMGSALATRDVGKAIHVLRRDAEIDRVRNLIFLRHTENLDGLNAQESLHVLFLANALERAGDHTKNIAEELCCVLTGSSIRRLLCSSVKPVEQLFLGWLAKQNSAGK